MGGVELPDAPVGIPDDFNEQLDVMFELMALAYQANMTRVVYLHDGEEVSMRTYNASACPMPSIRCRITRTIRQDRRAGEDPDVPHEVFARFIKKLATTQDGEGTLLDHSIVLFGSNMSNSDLHNNDSAASAVFGRGCGTIKGGQHLKYPQDTPHANLLLTLLERARVPVEGRQQHRQVRGSVMRIG